MTEADRQIVSAKVDLAEAARRLAEGNRVDRRIDHTPTLGASADARGMQNEVGYTGVSRHRAGPADTLVLQIEVEIELDGKRSKVWRDCRVTDLTVVKSFDRDALQRSERRRG